MTLTLRPSTKAMVGGTGSASLVEEWRPVYIVGTAVALGCIRDTGVRDIVSDWDDIVFGIDDTLATNDEFTRVYLDPTALMHRPATWIATGASALSTRVLGAGSAVSVIEELADRLEFPIDRVLAAADIKPRTFYVWRERAESQPRLASQGRLWALKQCIDDLGNLVEAPSRWLIDPKRLALLEAGAFDELVQIAAGQSRPAYAGVAGIGFTGDDSIVVVGPRDDGPPRLRKAKRVRRR
jgi:hypothetical protein